MKVRLIFEAGYVELDCNPSDFMSVKMKALRKAQMNKAKPEPMKISGYEFLTTCAYCAEPFPSQNPVEKYCSKSHRNLASLYSLTATAKQLTH